MRVLALVFGLALAFAPPRLAHADTASTSGEGEDDPELAQYRERFKQGLDRYEANDVAGALSYWEPLYRDLGPERGYRVGYNLARAYEVVGDLSRAAERYASFLDEVKKRRAAGKPIDDVVSADETKASDRLAAITRERGRIHVAPTAPPEAVRIDQSEPRLAGFVAYVAPGDHDVVFAPGSSHEKAMHVSVRAGGVVEVALPKTPEPPRVVWHELTKHPLGPAWLWSFGAATLVVGGGLTALAYGNALALHDGYAATRTQAQVNDYDAAKTLAYASWAAPATLAVVTIALVVWYAAGTKHLQVPTTLAVRF